VTHKNDPLVLVTGGGGLRYIRGFTQYIGEVLAGRELIIMDQRGTGRSEPLLDCPELNTALNQNLDEPLLNADQIQQASGALQTCRQRWTAAGINLQNYTSAASAADLDDLRQALGYQQWNLFATSGGAHLAYLVMRDYAAGVRSAVIDSTTPEDANRMVEQVANTQAAISGLFALCAQDEKCNETYPDIEARFYRVVEDLNASPQLLEVQNLSSGARTNVHVDGEVILQLTINAISGWDERVLAEVPQLVAQLEKGQTDLLKTGLSMSYGGLPLPGSGLSWLTNCTEILPLVNEDRVEGALAGANTDLAGYFRKIYEAQVSICPVFDGLLTEPAQLAPVSGGAPTLVVYTNLSPDSSLAWSQSATSKLNKAWIVEFKSPGGGAYIGGQSCGGIILRGFIDDPTASPNASCADHAPVIRWITFQQ
jgi:pimeloyl-ACP methyl ester carboxylesterase